MKFFHTFIIPPLLFIFSFFIAYYGLLEVFPFEETPYYQSEHYIYIDTDYLEEHMNEEEKEQLAKYRKVEDTVAKFLAKNHNVEVAPAYEAPKEITTEKKDYYSIEFGQRQFLLSEKDNSYDYGFITKEIKNGVLYLYSHNSYKFSENSGYYFYNNLYEGATLTFNGREKYRVKKIEDVDFKEGETTRDLKVKDKNNIVYFTCTPQGVDKRRVYILEKQGKN